MARRRRLDPHCRRLEQRREGHHRPVRPDPVHVFLAEHDLVAGSDDLGYADVKFSFGPAAPVGRRSPATGMAQPRLLAAGGQVTASADTPALSQAQLQPIVNEAIARWSDAGLDAAAVAKLEQVQVAIADLPGSYLGEAEANQIYIDGNAAGYGWFVDPTPASDEEFAASPGTSNCRPWIRGPSIGSIC